MRTLRRLIVSAVVAAGVTVGGAVSASAHQLVVATPSGETVSRFLGGPGNPGHPGHEFGHAVVIEQEQSGPIALQ